MPHRTLRVLLYGDRIGELVQDRAGGLRFSYDAELLDQTARTPTPLSLSLPTRTRDAMADAAADPAVRSLDSPLPAMLVDSVAERTDSALRELRASQ